MAAAVVAADLTKQGTFGIEVNSPSQLDQQ